MDMLDRMAKYQPGHGQYNFYADTRWKGPVTPAHKFMKYDPKSLYGWKGAQVIPMHYDPKSLDHWNPHIDSDSDSDYSFYDRFPDGVESDADIRLSEGGKKRKNTIKRRKRRNGRKSRRNGRKSRKVGKSRRNGRSKH